MQKSKLTTKFGGRNQKNIKVRVDMLKKIIQVLIVIILITYTLLSSIELNVIYANNFINDTVQLEDEYILKLFNKKIDITNKYNNENYSVYKHGVNDLDKNNEFFEFDESEKHLSEGLWGLETIKYTSVAEETYNIKELNSVTVAVLDTGVSSEHPDLKECMVSGFNFLENSTNTNDDNGHGTQMAGLIAGKTTGVAHGVNIMPIKILDKNGNGNTENFVKGIIWAVDNGADIINLSLGRRKFIYGSYGKIIRDTYSELERLAIEYALINGVTVVTVVGNFSENDTCYPAAYTYRKTLTKPIIVSAIDENKDKLNLSNYSDRVDVSAPGQRVLSTYPFELDIGFDLYMNKDHDGYILSSGTSHASAFVAGFCSIVKAYNKNLTNDEIREIVLSSVTDIGDEGWDEYFGYGIIDFEKLLSFSIPRISKISILEDGDLYQDAIRLYDKNSIANCNNNMSVSESVYITVEEYLTEPDIYLLKDFTVQEMVYGKFDYQMIFEDVGLYKLNYSIPDNSFVQNSSKVVIKPKKILPNISPGCYEKGVNLELLSPTSGASIYYTINNMPVVVNDELNPNAIKYQKPIIINSSTKLNAVAYKKGILSKYDTFEYIINDGNNNMQSRKENVKDLHKIRDVSENRKNIERVNLIETQDSIIYKNMLEKYNEFIIAQNLLEYIEKTQKNLIIDIDELKINIGTKELIELRNLKEDLVLKINKLDIGVDNMVFCYSVDLLINEQLVDKNSLLDLYIKLDPTLNPNNLAVCYLEDIVNSNNMLVDGFFIPEHFVIPHKNGSIFLGRLKQHAFCDVKDEYISDIVNFLWIRNIIKGISSNEFKPNDILTRAELSVLLNKYFGISSKNDYKLRFIDVPHNSWFYKDVKSLTDFGIIKGITELEFKPNDSVKKQDLIVLYVKTFLTYFSIDDKDIITYENNFAYNDEYQISAYAKQYVEIAKTIGIIEPNTELMFMPCSSVTREEAVEILYKLIINASQLKYINYKKGV